MIGFEIEREKIRIRVLEIEIIIIIKIGSIWMVQVDGSAPKIESRIDKSFQILKFKNKTNSCKNHP